MVTCPRCCDDDVAPARFRWWHPLLFLFLLRHWRCYHCYSDFVKFVWRR